MSYTLECLDALLLADCETYLWTIDDMQEIKEILQSHHRLAGLHSSWERASGRLDAASVSHRVPQRGRGA